MSDLVKRLRKIGSSDPVGYNTMTVAADRIEAQEAEIKRLRDAFRHTPVSDAGGLQPDRCWQCGLDIRDAIHGKALEDVVVGENLFHEASLQSAVKSLIDTVEKSRNDQGAGKGKALEETGDEYE